MQDVKLNLGRIIWHGECCCRQCRPVGQALSRCRTLIVGSCCRPGSLLPRPAPHNQ
ncbi:hypothetical protein F751_1998 [Auxenochlorella protothecoides]|uniref:Uncharacterized protein n=1 Tax=Auxenochlorella protothecoides TaxID=3075 RepID=A0A087SHB5_AUXPR|nr:hypothetical protein F751_1998 [Auxenochlorella protothecoides]KFM25119.1 hypothetical protein F751_1998 [Auxenochlorella protothecoides]